MAKLGFLRLSRGIKTVGVLFIIGLPVMVADARAQTTSSGQALFNIFADRIETGPAKARALNALFLGQITSFPTPSAAGGFTWAWASDPALPVQVRRSQSFGSVFAECAVTTGAPRLNVGITFQHTRFDSIARQPITHLKSTFRLDAPGFSSDTTVDLALDRTIVTVAYGATANLDIGAVVPFGRAAVTGRTAYQRLNESVPYRYSAEADGSSVGPGYIILRAKIGLPSSDHRAFAVASDTHLPTGDPDKLLGTGKLQEKLTFIGEMPFGRLTPHVNVGCLFGGNGVGVRPFEVVPGIVVQQLTEPEPSPEFDYNVGAEHATSTPLTIAGDVIGRVLRRSLVVDFTTDSLGTTFFTFKPCTVHLLLGAIGAKLKVGRQSLITASVLFPLNSSGVKPAINGVIGFERAF